MEKTENKEETKPITWVNTLDFSQLFTIKGQGNNVYTQLSDPNKSGMILMEEFLTTKRGWYSVKNLSSLHLLTFYQNSGEEIDICQVFSNIENNMKAIEEEEDEKAMELIVPDYDPEKFLNRHAEKVCYWFALVRAPFLKALQERSDDFKEAQVVEETKEP